MKFFKQIDIDLPVTKVAELFGNAENAKHWQPKLISLEYLDELNGRGNGSRIKWKHKMGKTELEMIETVEKCELPHVYNSIFEAKGVRNISRHRFLINGDKTKWINENEFQFKGYMRLMCLLMPWAFKKQSYKYMLQFKEFAEKSANA